jgi:membrane-anchored glycerophosphoryl diester phosphodiesterase (GDPDase)
VRFPETIEGIITRLYRDASNRCKETHRLKPSTLITAGVSSHRPEFATLAVFHFSRNWYFAIFVFCSVLVFANVVHYILFRILRRKETGEHHHLGWGLQKYLGKPARAIFLLTCLFIVLPFIPGLPDEIEATVRQGLIMLTVIALGWFAVGCIYVLQSIMLRRYDLSAENNIRARRVHTQFQLFRRMLITFVVIVDIGALLWTFDDPRIWHYGSGLLASAGIAS